MPGEGANRLAHIAAALQWDRGRWIWLLAMVLALDLVLGLGDSVDALLRYDRGAIAAGGWWRLLTAHIVHLDLHHLLLNELGLVLMWALFADDYDAVEWCVIVLRGALAISSRTLVAESARRLVRGRLRRAAHGHGRGCARASAGGRWDRWILLGVPRAPSWPTSSSAATSRALVVVDAHLYGAACGFVVGAALSWRVAIIRPRSLAVP